MYHCQNSVINWTEVGLYVIKKPQVWCCDEVWRLATKQLDGCAHTLCWRAVLLKLKLVLCFQIYNECEICVKNWLSYTPAQNDQNRAPMIVCQQFL